VKKIFLARAIMRPLRQFFLLLHLTLLISSGQFTNPIFETEANCQKESIQLDEKDGGGYSIWFNFTAAPSSNNWTAIVC
jgi:hypothetical protein